MRDLLYMAWRYLAYHRIKTIILVLSITLIVFLPAGLKILVGESAESLTARAESTPLLVGAKGSPLELVLNSLYFESDTPPPIPFAETQRVTDSKLATAIPLYTRFRARGFPIVGTSLDYFDFRELTIAEGRQIALIGECVLGSAVAEELDRGAGAAVVSSSESAFDLAGVYPLKMHIVGVLAPKGTADDRAIFVDLKTAWIIQGLAHGHQDLAQPEAADGVLKRDGNVVVANASVMQFNEITPDNMDSFHFHGDPAEFPITAVIAVPHDSKSATLLQGQYLGPDEQVQLVLPTSVMDDLLATILTVQNYVLAGAMVIGLSALMTAVLVFMLSLRLRKREIETMHRIGSSRRRVTALLSLEIIIVLLSGILLAALLTVLASQFGEGLIRSFI
mgnify:CR=1 FL=1